MLTDHEIDQLELIMRFHVVLQAIGLPQIEWRVYVTLLGSPQPVSEKSLAEILGLPRTTTRNHVEDGISRGFLVRYPRKGLLLTLRGQEFTEKLGKQALELINGRQFGVSDDLIKTLDKTSFSYKQQYLKQLCFGSMRSRW